MIILALDPGTIKCGVAILGATGDIQLREIVPTATIHPYLNTLLLQWRITHAVCGLSTGSDAIQKLLTELSQTSTKSTFTVHGIDERDSTREARAIFWADNPPRGLMRLIPLSLLAPPVPVDDYAAVVLGRRFLQQITAATQEQESVADETL